MNEPKNIAGVWRGSYFYDLEQQRPPDGSGVSFELRLRQSWLQSLFGWFSGSVTDDSQRGMPGTGRISGRLRGASIRFTKRMPISYVTHEGRNIALRDWLRDQGFEAGYDIPHRPIVYRGAFTAADSASGTWRIAGGSIQITSRLSLPMLECTGTWTLTQ